MPPIKGRGTRRSLPPFSLSLRFLRAHTASAYSLRASRPRPAWSLYRAHMRAGSACAPPFRLFFRALSVFLPEIFLGKNFSRVCR